MPHGNASIPIINHVRKTHLRDPRPVAGTEAVGDWQLMPELPTSEEILADAPPKLDGNDVTIAPGSKAKYLETQYRLLRYEGTELLRRAVNEFQRNPNMMESGSFCIYTQVRLDARVTFKLLMFAGSHSRASLQHHGSSCAHFFFDREVTHPSTMGPV